MILLSKTRADRYPRRSSRLKSARRIALKFRANYLKEQCVEVKRDRKICRNGWPCEYKQGEEGRNRDIKTAKKGVSPPNVRIDRWHYVQFSLLSNDCAILTLSNPVPWALGCRRFLCRSAQGLRVGACVLNVPRRDMTKIDHMYH